VRSVFDLRAFPCAQRLLFARCFFVHSVFYSRAILQSSRFLFARLSLCAAFSYSRAILKSSRSLFARLSLCSAFCFCGVAQWNISIVVLYISMPLCMGESDNSFKKTLCLMNICPQDLLLSHELTLWFRRTIFLRPQIATNCHKLFGKCRWSKFRALSPPKTVIISQIQRVHRKD